MNSLFIHNNQIDNSIIVSDRNISDLKVYFHRYIFSDPSNISILIESLYSLDPFNINYDQVNRCISIKIKKTNMKKYNVNIDHDSMTYYNILNNYIRDFYNRFIINTEYDNYIYHNLINNNTILLYSISIINPNYIVIKL